MDCDLQDFFSAQPAVDESGSPKETVPRSARERAKKPKVSGGWPGSRGPACWHAEFEFVFTSMPRTRARDALDPWPLILMPGQPTPASPSRDPWTGCFSGCQPAPPIITPAAQSSQLNPVNQPSPPPGLPTSRRPRP
ncbi:uncharacterized protein N7482_004812 [Penicillium canariense]|uniref:Uncharacterized protein n=1 Tax=Penicillium canariense TaxID=189055 RepID=A0A9W9I9F9_9EURO|nr:uncharacterized protein N7482_004812 [Penicillium canariense]KAJ5169218.1 hypothetical protein N7482_004812 [Penicillium canariense]